MGGTIQTRGNCVMSSGNRRVQESIRLISEALVKLLHEKSLSEITISEICQTATVSRNTFYRSFSTKEDVLSDILEKKTAYIVNQFLISEDFDRLHPAGVDARRTYERLYRFWFAQKPLLETLYRQGLLWMLDMAYLKVVPAYAQEAYDKLSTPMDPDYFMDYFYFWHAVFMSKIIQKWVMRGCRESVDDLINVTIRLKQTMIVEDNGH